MKFSMDLNSMLGNKESTTDSWRTMADCHTDWEIRVLWSEYASKIYDWPYRGVPPNDVVTGRFICDWHETEYQVFKAGYLAAQNVYLKK